MADSVQPVILNKGWDTVTPPLLAEAGSVMDCLNYEVTDIVGYRRIDGYENYDGFPGGDVSFYIRISIAATDSLLQEDIVAGSIIYRSDNGLNAVAVGVVLGGPFDGTYYDIAPLQNLDAFVLSEQFLELSDGGFVQLADPDAYLLIIGDSDSLGSTFTVIAPDDTEIDAEVSGSPTDGSSLVTAEEYLTNLRAYSAALRASVGAAPAPVAGVYWFDDRLYAAVNATKVTITVDSLDPQPTDYMRVRWNGQVYYTYQTTLDDANGTNTYSTYLLPISTSSTVDDDLVEVAYDGTASTTWATGLEANGLATNTASDVAVLGYFNNPDIGLTREFVYLPPAFQMTYLGGTYSDSFGPPPTLYDNFYYIEGSDGTIMRVRLLNTLQASGAWGDNDSVGSFQIVVDEVLSGDRDYVIATDELHTETPSTGSSLVLTVSSDATFPALAGTRALDAAGTRYTWITANFYGQANSNAAWGANGAGRGFWANQYGYGMVTAVDDAELDKPKYVAYHATSLMYGYESGSVMRSVVGEPFNFSGLDGAVEFATGDNITGLLEMPGDTIAVFGRRSIRKITGTSPDDVKMGTIASNGGCFDYTAVMIGQEAVYTGVSGITTLQQTAAYGDFAGSRLSDRVANWLRPKLVVGFRSSEAGGTVMAYPVRSKNQYRLVLANGDVVQLALTGEGPKIMRLSYNLTGQTQIPYAWSSEIDHRSQERIHVVWQQLPRSAQVIELETGWGFNGVTFDHYFELAHLFFNSGANFGGIEGVRLHGQGYGVATLNVKAAGIEEDYNQDYHDRIQDISIPEAVEAIYDRFRPVTNIVDHANWGLGVKLMIQGTTGEGSADTEPSHICQALVLKVRTEGAQDG